MTIVDVLTHSSGLSYGFDPEGILNPVDAVYAAHAREMNGVPLLEWSDKLAKLPLFFQPQAAWHCAPPTPAQLHMRVSNHDCADGYNTDVCGALVEKISGMPFEEYLRQKIFSPLGMVDTAFWVPPNKRHRFADVYSENPNPAKIRAGEALVNVSTGPGQLEYIGEAPPVFSSGGGGLVATMHDCACSPPLLLPFARLTPLLWDAQMRGSASASPTAASSTATGCSASRPSSGWRRTTFRTARPWPTCRRRALATRRSQRRGRASGSASRSWRTIREPPQYRWHLGCILLKMPAISLLTGRASRSAASATTRGAARPTPSSGSTRRRTSLSCG